MRDELPDEFLRRRGGKLTIEANDQQMGHAKVANQRDLVLRCREQMRRLLRPQHLCGMRIEGDDDGRAARLLRMFGPMCEMTAW